MLANFRQVAGKQRRREYRAAMRKEIAAVEETAVKTADKIDSATSFNTKQIVKHAEMSKFEVVIATQKEVKNYQMTEAIEVNFNGCLNDQKIDLNDQLRTIYVHRKIHEGISNENMNTCICTFKVFVKNNEIATHVVESWK